MSISKTAKFKIHLSIWSVLVFAVSAGIAGFYLSTREKTVDLVLQPGASANISILRPFPSTLSSALIFQWEGGRERPELGNTKSMGNFSKTGYVEYPNPGSPVKLKISSAGKSYIYEAKPAKTNVSPAIRNLTFFVDDGFPNRFQGTPSSNWLHFSSGISDLHIEVIEVGENILGEKIKLVIYPPLAFMLFTTGYGILWFFYFWPIYTLILIVYAMRLVVMWRNASDWSPLKNDPP